MAISICESQAERIAILFQGGLHSFHKEINDFRQKHKYDCVRSPMSIPQLGRLAMQGYDLNKGRQKPLVAKKAVDSSDFCLIAEATSQSGSWDEESEHPLTSDRVASCQLKEHVLVAKKLKKIPSQPPNTSLKNQVVPLKKTKKETSPDSYDWGRKEERQFLMNRVIKYLLD